MSIVFKNWDIYLSRFLSALCLFLILAEANIYLDTINNTLLVLGYRLFILLTPLFFMLYKHKLTFAGFIIAEIGLLCWLSNLTIIGTILFATGIAISGYMLKYYSSFSASGAAGNKIALNAGSILSGVLVMLSQNWHILLIFSIASIATTFFIFTKYYHREHLSITNTTKSDFSLKTLCSKRGIAWALVGLVTGVKLIALVSILPQFIMSHHHGKLPSWYGSMIIINCIIIVALQMPIMKKVSHLSRIRSLFPLLVGMVIVTCSSILNISTLSYALFWTIGLSLIECAISYLDKLARDDGLLLIKEAFVGIGSAATVLSVRALGPEQGSLVIGLVSISLLFISMGIFKVDKISLHSKPKWLNPNINNKVLKHASEQL